MVAQLLNGLRRAVDVRLGPGRRTRAESRLRALGTLREILVLCQGNICRSPYAAAVLEELLRDRGIQVGSAGFLPPGRPAPPHAIAVARARGVDLGWHRSRAITPPMLRAADLVIVMEPAQRTRLRHEFGIPDARILVLGDLDPGATELRGITDPWDHPREVFEQVYARIERCAGALAEQVARSFTTSGASGPRSA
jgi:protein-tyrosine phosphatase